MQETKTSTQTNETIKVLIVEAYKLMRISLSYFLETDKNIKVISQAENAYTAINSIKQQKPDVVVTELNSLDMDGFEMIKKIKEENPQTKIIIYTTRDDKKSIIQAMSSNIDGYCIKDDDSQMLIEAIKNAVHGIYSIDYRAKRAIDDFFKNFKNSPFDILEENKNQQPLTKREQEVLDLIVKGKTNTEIAENLIITSHTAKAHVSSILNKLGVDDRLSAALKAVLFGYCSYSN